MTESRSDIIYLGFSWYFKIRRIDVAKKDSLIKIGNLRKRCQEK